jgi:NADH-quinone oxidoreductase subunit F
MLANQPDSKGKFLVCNADEGDPGAYMDRSVLEGNPHSIIEGMIIGAYATRANQGVIYVRNEYPLAIKHLTIALRQAHDIGLLGENILGTGFSFDIKIVRGAGAFVCGEETALMRSIEGKIGEPSQRPPFPTQKGINGRPTAINNVETWANIPVVIEKGAEEFSKVGTKNNSGTKIFSLVGKVKYTGLVEVPMGMTIGEIVNDIGGGPVGDAKIKAVQTGGPSGGCIPAAMFDLRIDYDNLAKAGTIMGSGGMIVMDENTCMVDVAKYFMNFLKSESCGKCFSCRKGTQRMYEILDDITKGKATLAEFELLKELAVVVKDTTMCGLGHGAPNPVLSTIRYFTDEYKRHIIDKKCDAFVCKDLVGAPCQSACPIGTEAWRYIAHIQHGEFDAAYQVIRETNPLPSVCARVCNHPCEEKCRAGTSGGQPISIRELKRFVVDRFSRPQVRPARTRKDNNDATKVAVIGSGPAGLTAAHYLSMAGYKVTVWEADKEPGGMLISCIPAYRLPRTVLRQEINSLIDDHVTIKCDTVFGKDITIDSLFDDGYKAIFLAIGAHESRRLNVSGEDSLGVYPSIQFLKRFNLQGERLAQGRVGIVGGGNSAIDAARVAIRQEGVKSVTVLYRRTRREMPAFSEEIDACLDEGINLMTLVSPSKIIGENNHLTGLELLKNNLGERDASGRRQPVPIPGSQFVMPLDTLIVAVGEQPKTEYLATTKLNIDKSGIVKVDPETLATNRPGVFAGGDLVRGPNTVVDAIADGKTAAVMIERYLRGEKLQQPKLPRRPKIYIESKTEETTEGKTPIRVKLSSLPIEQRQKSFAEVNLRLSEPAAIEETHRCLRCDLDFTQPKKTNSEEKKLEEIKV